MLRNKVKPCLMRPWRLTIILALLVGLLPWKMGRADEPISSYFGIRAVDEQTGRGVPLVELETVNHLRYVTDSAGWIALNEPGLMGERVFCHVRSHGYEYPKDGFGFAGVVLTPEIGKTTEIRLKRRNIAQRLYRITGEGIYRDSLLLGQTVPLPDAKAAGKVMGQDSAFAAPYRKQLFWFWGDTNRIRYPLGHFWTSGATSQLPGHGGMDPAEGVKLEYFVGGDGFSRPMARMGVEKGLIWIDAVCALPDATGRDRLICHYAHVKSLGELLGHGLAVYNDDTQQFERLKMLEMDQLWQFPGQAHPIHDRVGASEYLSLGEVFPTVRVPATLEGFADVRDREAWTCLQPGSDVDQPEFLRDGEGRLTFHWQKNGPPSDIAAQWKWVTSGKIKREEACYVPLDVDSGKPIRLHRGSVAWNAHRQKWIMIAGEQGGTSMLGEIWYAEAAHPTGPWQRAKKIVTHDKYSFYNPVHHPFFDQDGGRVIYFEGTYTTTFSGNTVPTPRYDYNQIMYRLDLDDPRLQSVRD